MHLVAGGLGGAGLLIGGFAPAAAAPPASALVIRGFGSSPALLARGLSGGTTPTPTPTTGAHPDAGRSTGRRIGPDPSRSQGRRLGVDPSRSTGAVT